MNLKVSNNVLEEIVFLWRWLEEEHKSELENELQQFKSTCNNYANWIIRGTKSYMVVYNVHIEKDSKNFSLLKTFFTKLREISEEAYNFLTEGYEVINLKEAFNYKDKDEKEAIRTILGLKSLSSFIEHAFIKLLNETDLDKKAKMISGLVGI